MASGELRLNGDDGPSSLAKDDAISHVTQLKLRRLPHEWK